MTAAKSETGDETGARLADASNLTPASLSNGPSS
jgi:hypothetical protein